MSLEGFFPGKLGPIRLPGYSILDEGGMPVTPSNQERTGPIADLYRLFPDRREQIDLSEEWLRAALRGEIDPKAVVNPVIRADPGMAPWLRINKIPELDNLTVMQVIRKQIEFEKTRPVQEAASTPPSSGEQSTTRRLQTGFGFPVTSVRSENDTRISILDNPATLESFSPSLRVIHLRTQSVINLPTIRRLLAEYPGLRIIQIPPSLKRLIGPSVQAALDERGITLQIERVRDSEYYDETRADQKYEEKRELFHHFLELNDNAADIAFMEKYDFLELKLAKLYYGDERLSVQKIADRLGIPHSYTLARLQIMNHFAGYPTRSSLIETRTKAMRQRIANLRIAEQNEANMHAYRSQFAVGNILPPQTLTMKNWETWQRLKQLEQTHPERFASLRSSQPRLYDILMDYFALHNDSQRRKNGVTLASEHSISRERISQLKNIALTELGLLDE